MSLADHTPDREARRLLQDIGRAEAGERLDLALGALALAALEAPAAKLEPYREHLERLTADLRAIVGEAPGAHLSVEDAQDALTHVIFGLHGYQGDRETYDDLQNANLIRVIDRRKGLPVALGVLYIATARAVGFEAAGLDFPGHFLVRLESAGGRAVIDPFNDGAALDAAALRGLVKQTLGAEAELEAAHYEAAADKDVLLRLQNNLKLRLIQGQQLDRAAEILDGMLTIAPERAALWREAGLVNAHIGNFRTAVAALEIYLERESRESARQEAAALIEDLRRKIN